jgi:predicted RNA-binding Zn ribbon-like protein
METVSASALRIVGGNAGLDLANSRSGPHDGGVDIDALGTPADLVTWAEHAGVVDAAGAAALRTADPDALDGAFGAALALRDAVHDVFHDVSRGAEPRDRTLDALAAAVADARASAHARREGDRLALHWSPDDPRTIVRLCADAADTLLRHGPLSRVKQCAGCSFLFLDESKNGSRRWCSMDDCGRSEKMRLYVERRRARAASGQG